MIIQHNISSVNAYGKLVANTSDAKKSSEILASGYRINKAADDAAGLAVSEKMRSQIVGLRQAERNCQDGINMIQTFEGALKETHSIIKRCKELAIEAANGTYDNETDRAALELEFRQLCGEVDQISDTDYNGIVMLNGGQLASVDQASTMGWLNPINVNWLADTVQNLTDDPDFSMNISKLPALDNMTLVSAAEFKALEEFNNAEISVMLNNGKATFYFTSEPAPKNVSIQTRNNIGYVSINTAEGITEIAKVTLPNVIRTVTSEGFGRWSTSTGSARVNTPKSPPDKTDLTLPTNDAGAAYDALRKDYDEWTTSFPRVEFKISDDLKTFTIPQDLNPDAANIIKDYDPDRVYNNNTTLTVISPPNSTETRVDVKWNADIVKPGSTIHTYSGGYYGVGASDTLYNGYDSKGHSIYYTLSLGTASGTARQKCFLEHGNERFSLTYKETQWPDSDGIWTLTINNYDTRQGDSSTGTLKTSDNTIIDKYLAQFGLSRANVTNALTMAHKRTGAYHNMFDSHYTLNGVPNGVVPIKDGDTYSFGFSVLPSSPSYSPATAWNPNSKSDVFNLKEYDPNSPEKGGIDYDIAIPGNIYTYRNDKLTDTLDPGYWVDGDGNIVNLEDVGIYLPDKKHLGSYNDILHDGLRISLGEKISGATGRALGKVKLWESSDNVYSPILNDNLGGMTYLENVIIQSNSRSKDGVSFTFRYHSETLGDLICDLNCSAEGLGMSSLDLKTQSSANSAIDMLNKSLDKVSMVRASFGATQNRLEHKIADLNTTRENVTQSESTIRDADIASEMINFTKSQIIQQAAQSMLAQSNQMPQTVLQLIGQ